MTRQEPARPSGGRCVDRLMPLRGTGGSEWLIFVGFSVGREG